MTMNEEPEIPFEALEPELACGAIGNRVCAEPVPIGRLMGELRDSALMRGVPEPDDAKHPWDGLCRQCNTPLDVKWTQLDRCAGWFPVNIHIECLPAYYATIGCAGIQTLQWQRICPPDFREPWNQMRGNNALLKRVLQFDPKLRRGMLIRGVSGSGKTRCAWLLARQLMENGTAVTFVASIDLPDENVREMTNTECLIIDDLGNDKMQASREALVLKILRSRMDWHRPTIITTQFNGERLMERFSDGHTAQAVIRRLREFCDDVIGA